MRRRQVDASGEDFVDEQLGAVEGIHNSGHVWVGDVDMATTLRMSAIRDLEQIRDLLEHGRDVGVGHGGLLAGRSGPAPGGITLTANGGAAGNGGTQSGNGYDGGAGGAGGAGWGLVVEV